jgi:hypothetical protein
MRTYRLGLSALLLVAAAATAAAQEIKVGGQLRPRYEVRDPIDLSEGDADAFVSMRARANVTAALEGNVSVFLQVQDVRIWGEETNTLGDFSADNFDLHQGYIDLESAEKGKFLGRFGRQEVKLGAERLIGPVGWTQQSRSFDGVRLATEGDFGRVDILAAQLGNELASDVDRDSELLLGYGTLDVADDQAVDLYAIYNRQDSENEFLDTETSQGTFGARWVGKTEDFTYRAEASFQTGQRAGTDVSAYMFGARFGYGFAEGRAAVTLWYDYLSGDDDATDGEIKVFDTLFATNHKFYGFADMFLNIPAHTSGQGLQDFAVKGSFKPVKDWKLGADIHSFRLAKEGVFESGHLGEEVNIVATYAYSKNVNLQGGFAHIFQDDTWAFVGRRLEDNMTWFYLMIDAKF